MKKMFLLLTMALVLSSCAMSRSHFETADGDKASKMAMSTIGKQEVQQKTDFQAYPNNSGLSLQDGAVSSQDTTQIVAVINAIVSAYAGQLAHQQDSTSPSTLSRIEQLTQQIEQLRALVDLLRKP